MNWLSARQCVHEYSIHSICNFYINTQTCIVFKLFACIFKECHVLDWHFISHLALLLDWILNYITIHYVTVSINSITSKILSRVHYCSLSFATQPHHLPWTRFYYQLNHEKRQFHLDIQFTFFHDLITLYSFQIQLVILRYM